MKFGIALNTYELGTGDDCADLHSHLDLVTHGYERGLRSIFVFEHHFSGYLVSPAPLLTIGFLAGRLPEATFGTSVLVLPLHDTVRLAEQIALLDNLTRGRCLFGFGVGRSTAEYEGLGCDKATSVERFPLMMSRLIELLASDPASHSTPIRPRPRYSPHKRFYTAGRRLDILGIRVMRNYAPTMPRSPGSVVFVPITLARTTEAARRLALRVTHADLVLRNKHYGVTPTRPTPEQVQSAVGSQVVGSAVDAAEQIQTIGERTACEHLVFEFAFGGRDLDEAAHMIDLFGTRVLPLLSGNMRLGEDG
ncbi:MAG: LLM class flavin-dependent oxidoreductase [Pseudonocardiaceae bacterium]